MSARKQWTAVLAGAVLTMLVVAGPASASSTRYAVGKPACAAPAHPGQLSCFAVQRIPASRGTPGARSYLVADGATGAAAQGPAGGLTPADLATAYGLNSTGGAGQTVAIVDAFNDPKMNADLQTFDSQYGLAPCSTSNGCLKIVNENGGTALPANDTTGWAVEEALDVEAVHSVCQGCKIILLEASSPNNAPLAAAENEAITLGATEVTNSFGGPESGSDASFQSAFNHPGTVITASTGDDGYYDFDFLGANGHISQPNTPSAFGTVVAVGGTSLTLNAGGHRTSETVWNDNGRDDAKEKAAGRPLGATGGGCSTIFAAPAWQTSEPGWANTVCNTKRLDADISAVGDYLTGFDIYHSFNCGTRCAPLGWTTVGGTSLSSPVIAAMYALVGGAHGVQYPALTLYGHPGATFDVHAGGNGYCGGDTTAACGNPNQLGEGVLDCLYPPTGNTRSPGTGACDAKTGFDGPSGLGAPKGLTVFRKTGPAVTVGGPTSIAHGTSGHWTASATDPFPGGSISSYAWTWGDGTPKTVTTTGAASHTYSAAGTYTITVTAKDGYGVTGAKTYAVSVS